MSKTRIWNPRFTQCQSAWPNAVQSVTPFISTNERNFSMIVYLFNYAIIELLQISSISKVPFSVTDVIVNGEFRPALSLAYRPPWVTILRLPKPMSLGTSFSAVLRAPAAPAIPPGSCYPKPPVSLVVSTDYLRLQGRDGHPRRAMTPMKTLCAWCGHIVFDGPEEPASHGICHDCEAAMYYLVDSGNGTGPKKVPTVQERLAIPEEKRQV